VAKAGFENAFREHWKLSPKAETWVKEPYRGSLLGRQKLGLLYLPGSQKYVSIWVQICQRSHQEWVIWAPDILGWDLNVKLALIILYVLISFRFNQ
jgi:hypothetical protein